MNLTHMEIQILATGLMILGAYTGGVVAIKFNIGEVVGQILGGMLIGPYCLGLLFKKIFIFYGHDLNTLNKLMSDYKASFDEFHFFIFLFLGVVIFSLGEELHFDRVRSVGKKAAYICIIQAIMTWGIISIGFAILPSFSKSISMLIGAIGIATAPGLIFILMNKLKIEGKLKNTLANVVVLDNVIEVAFFSVFLSLSIAFRHGETLDISELVVSLIYQIGGALLLGVILFFIMKFMVAKVLPQDDMEDRSAHGFLASILSEHPTPSIEMLLIIVGVVSVGTAVALYFEFPFLIALVLAGLLVSNLHSHVIFDSLKIGEIMPLFNLVFFALIGASVKLNTFTKESVFLVIFYILLRSLGKIGGSTIGCYITDQDPKIKACLPNLMLPQAGVAAVETFLAANLIGGEKGTIIYNTIIPAIIFFEIAGAFLSEKTLIRWKTWTAGEKEALKDKTTSNDLKTSEFLDDRVLKISGNTMEEVIHNIALKIAEDNGIDDITSIIHPLMEREKLASTAVGGKVAFQHLRTTLVDDVKAICGILQTPVDWKAPDRKEVEVIFLIMTPVKYPEQHLKALRSIAHLLSKGDFREKAQKALDDNIKLSELL